MSGYADLEQMLITVAKALSDELLQRVAFIIGFPHWAAFQTQLKTHGFTVRVTFIFPKAVIQRLP